MPGRSPACIQISSIKVLSRQLLSTYLQFTNIKYFFQIMKKCLSEEKTVVSFTELFHLLMIACDIRNRPPLNFQILVHANPSQVENTSVMTFLCIPPALLSSADSSQTLHNVGGLLQAPWMVTHSPSTPLISSHPCIVQSKLHDLTWSI